MKYLFLIQLRGGGVAVVMSLYQLLSRVWLFETPWTPARQAPLSLGFSRQRSQSGHSLLQRIFPGRGIEPRSPALQAYSLLFELQGSCTLWEETAYFDRSRGGGTGKLEVESQGRVYKREKLVLSLQGWTQLQKEKMTLAAEADSSQVMTCFRSVGK